jgi:hypothetical protein
MKKLVIIFVFLFCMFFIANAQYRTLPNTNVAMSKSVDLYVNDLDKTQAAIDLFITKYEIKPLIYNISDYRIDLTMEMKEEAFTELDSLVKIWGYVRNENVSSNNFSDELEKINQELELLNTELNSYLALVKSVDSNANDRYFEYYEKIITLQKEIATKNIEKSETISKYSTNLYKLEIEEEINSTMEYETDWINMPGLEYSILFTEQPEKGVSPEMMSGISLKYMFNTGKSYGILGLYKSMDDDTLTTIDETYVFAFGQDFYSKRMGRGQRKFFNLYTSINLGVYISTSETQNVMSWFVNPYLGLEIFKNKYFLIDNKVGYFLPYRNNRVQRGLLYNASFNFVF